MRQLSGAILVVIAAIGFGFMGLFGSWAMNAGVSVEMMLFLRFAIAGAIMSIIMVGRGERWPRGRILLGLIGMGAALYVGEAMFFFHATRHIPVGLVSLLLYIYPVIVTLYAWLFLHQPLRGGRLLALILALAGLALTIGPTILNGSGDGVAGGNPVVGVLLGIGCCVKYSVYIVVGGPMTRRAGAIPGSTIVILSAASVLGAIALIRGDELPRDGHAWLGIVLLALASTVIAITAVLVGLERIGPVQTSMLSTLEPLVTVLVGAGLMGQRLTLPQMAGGALIVLAAVIIARTVTASPQSPPSDADVLEIH